MSEYFFIAIFILMMFFITSYLKAKYLKESKWKNIVMDVLAFLLILSLFIFGHENENGATLYNFKTLLIVLTCGYFAYKIYKDIKLLKTK